MRALIIDDSKPVRGILARVLGEMGCVCDAAADGREGVALLERGPRPDVVALNIHMPVMDGFEVMAWIRSRPELSGLKIVALSSDQSPAVVSRAMAGGAAAFVAKPFTPAAIAEAFAAAGLRAARPQPEGVPAVRVLVVDDSAAIRGTVSAALASDPEVRVAGTAADGVQGLARVAEVVPDVVLLDVEMPVMDGLSMLRELRRIHPRLPVVMFSTLTERGAKVALDALVAGANDYVPKPKGATPEEVTARIREEVIPKLKQFRRRSLPGAPGAGQVARPAVRARPDVPFSAVVVGVSTGGPVALAEFLPAFVSRDGVPVLIVQHMPATFTPHLAERLTKICGLPVREARDGEELRPGDILLAPGGRHLQVARSGSKVVTRLDDGAPENSCRPAADVLFRSAAAAWREGTLAVVLTGMGKDGLEGSRVVREAGGAVIAQDEATSTVWGMPGHVARAGLADAVLPLGRIGVDVALRLRRRP